LSPFPFAFLSPKGGCRLRGQPRKVGFSPLLAVFSVIGWALLIFCLLRVFLYCSRIFFYSFGEGFFHPPVIGLFFHIWCELWYVHSDLVLNQQTTSPLQMVLSLALFLTPDVFFHFLFYDLFFFFRLFFFPFLFPKFPSLPQMDNPVLHLLFPRAKVDFIIILSPIPPPPNCLCFSFSSQFVSSRFFMTCTIAYLLFGLRSPSGFLSPPIFVLTTFFPYFLILLPCFLGSSLL